MPSRARSTGNFRFRFILSHRASSLRVAHLRVRVFGKLLHFAFEHLTQKIFAHAYLLPVRQSGRI
jgi:hypothetical protein